MGEITELNPDDERSTLEELSLLAGSGGSVILSRSPFQDELGVEIVHAVAADPLEIAAP